MKVPVALRSASSSCKVNPGFITSGAKIVELEIASIPENDPPIAVEHHEALAHIVQGGVHLQLLLADLVLRMTPLGDILVRGHPAAAGHRLVERLDKPARRWS